MKIFERISENHFRLNKSTPGTNSSGGSSNGQSSGGGIIDYNPSTVKSYQLLQAGLNDISKKYNGSFDRSRTELTFDKSQKNKKIILLSIQKMMKKISAGAPVYVTFNIDDSIYSVDSEGIAMAGR